MFSKYEITIDDYFYNKELNSYLETGKEIYAKHEANAKKRLKEFIYDNGHIDGTSLKNNWFGIQHVDVFISHSHKDISKVKAFAGWLYSEFGLTAFIDSCAWGYCNDLLREIDNKYCYNEDGKTYNYNLRNYTTSHVHMMLSTALTEMINNAECIMFYNTPNSVSMTDDLEYIKHDRKKITLSPWIYHELAMTSLVKRNRPKRSLKIVKSILEHTDFSETNTINVEYDIDQYLNNLVTVTSKELKQWKREYAILTDKIDGTCIPVMGEYEDVHPLDVLYSLSI